MEFKDGSFCFGDNCYAYSVNVVLVAVVTFTFTVKQYICQACFRIFMKNHMVWFPSRLPCNWDGFRISLLREGAIFRDEIENCFSCSHLARRDGYYDMTIHIFRDENDIRYCYSHVSRRYRDFRQSFLVVEREKNEADSRRGFLEYESSRLPLSRLPLDPQGPSGPTL